MKKLVVIRHAKSSWTDPGLRDFDRPLNDRGFRDAPIMGRRILAKQLVPQLMLSSPANRALTTCRLIAHEIGYSKRIVTSDELYHAGAEEILEVVRQIENHIEVVFIFGHNPGFTDFVNELTDESIDNIPTCGVAVCELTLAEWRKVIWKAATLAYFDYPKKKH